MRGGWSVHAVEDDSAPGDSRWIDLAAHNLTGQKLSFHVAKAEKDVAAFDGDRGIELHSQAFKDAFRPGTQNPATTRPSAQKREGATERYDTPSLEGDSKDVADGLAPQVSLARHAPETLTPGRVQERTDSSEKCGPGPSASGARTTNVVSGASPHCQLAGRSSVFSV